MQLRLVLVDLLQVTWFPRLDFRAYFLFLVCGVPMAICMLMLLAYTQYFVIAWYFTLLGGAAVLTAGLVAKFLPKSPFLSSTTVDVFLFVGMSLVIFDLLLLFIYFLYRRRQTELGLEQRRETVTAMSPVAIAETMVMNQRAARKGVPEWVLFTENPTRRLACSERAATDPRRCSWRSADLHRHVSSGCVYEYKHQSRLHQFRGMTPGLQHAVWMLCNWWDGHRLAWHRWATHWESPSLCLAA
jgi:hypothetical protein